MGWRPAGFVRVARGALVLAGMTIGLGMVAGLALALRVPSKTWVLVSAGTITALYGFQVVRLARGADDVIAQLSTVSGVAAKWPYTAMFTAATVMTWAGAYFCIATKCT